MRFTHSPYWHTSVTLITASAWSYKYYFASVYVYIQGADLTNRRGKRPLGAPSDICETYLANASVHICVIESVKCFCQVRVFVRCGVLQACESSHYNM